MRRLLSCTNKKNFQRNEARKLVNFLVHDYVGTIMV